MAETPTSSSDPPLNGSKNPAPKNKACPFCGQSFTSSSLGRHLDLYIKEKNPKSPDGIHDLDAIRKIRCNITRRQPRGSLDATGRRHSSGPAASTPASTPRPLNPHAGMEKASEPELPAHPSSIPDTAAPENARIVTEATAQHSFAPRWDGPGACTKLGRHPEGHEIGVEDAVRRSSVQRTVNKQFLQKAQFDAKSKMTDAIDRARAAELALREFLSSWRAAKQHVSNTSMPFDFNPLSLDFPALVLQCLPVSPALFASIQHSIAGHWSTQPPSSREFEALQAHFRREFGDWRSAVTRRMAAVYGDLTYASRADVSRESEQGATHAQREVNMLEGRVAEHLQAAFVAWERLPEPGRSENWLLEMARCVARKEQEVVNLKKEMDRLAQDNANLKAHIDQLNRPYQPREYRAIAPVTFAADRDVVAHIMEQGVKGIALDADDHTDLNTLVARSIERWKPIVTASRLSTSGMSSQRPFESAAAAERPAVSEPPTITPTTMSSACPTPPTAEPPTPQPNATMTSTSTVGGGQSEINVTSTGPPSLNSAAPSVSGGAPSTISDPDADGEADADADADAEMEDDETYPRLPVSVQAAMSPAKPASNTQFHQAVLDVTSTRVSSAMQAKNNKMGDCPRFGMQNRQGIKTTMGMTQAMAAMAPTNLTVNQVHMSSGADIGLGIQGEQMYMD